MVTIASLWMPILLSAVLVFVASSLIHMVLKYHAGDYRELPDEDAARGALRAVPPGNYVVPYCASMSEMGSPEFTDKRTKGPVGFINLMPPGPVAMGKALGVWFVYTLVVGVFVAYISGRTLAPGEHYLRVFRIAGAVAFVTYAGAEPVNSIWRGLRWSTTVKSVVDGLIYSLVTAGVFGWLWPR